MRMKAGTGTAPSGALAQAASSRRFLLYLSITLIAAVFVVVTQNLGHGIGRELSSSSSIFVRPERRARSEPENVLVEPKSSSKSHLAADEDAQMIISDVIAFPEDEFLVLLAGDDHRLKKDSSRLKGTCVLAFGDQEQPQEAKILGAGFQSQGRFSIRCGSKRRLAAESISSSSVAVQLHIKMEEPPRTIIIHGAQLELLWWNRLVLDAAVDDSRGDLVLFTKGIFKKEQEIPPEGSSCVFFSQDGAEIAETQIVGLAQEIVRCKQPAGIKLLGNRVSIKYSKNSVAVPSVAIYGSPRPNARADDSAPSETKQRHLVCACTMIYNGAKFLREWIEYHSHLGIDKFFLYDNNSEDGLERTVALLNSDGLGTAGVERRLWPWIKTQEAGFSHCALTARRECEWMAFVDVDEFLFPKNWLQEQQHLAPESGTLPFAVDDSTILERVIRDVQARRIPLRNKTADPTAPVGQISFHCRDFGPSGLTRHPKSGVTQGYTCRVSKEQRHKSLVKLEALDPSLINVIHHFDLNPGYATAKIPTWKGVVNHYKYQAWNEFKNKFKRRVSAYVVDWKENKNINSQDRTPGLGYRAVKPTNWERQFCEVEDTALRDYVLKIFKPRWTSSLPWQVQ